MSFEDDLFEDKLKAHAKRISARQDLVKTEEATKNSLIMPFFQDVLGYDISDPTEVVPEFSADVGPLKEKKVDYAIMDDNGNPVLLVECKKASVNLADREMAQLFQYFSVSDARIGVLTNGIVYQFFSDIEKENLMDSEPFLEVDLLNFDDSAFIELKRFAKQSFDVDSTLEAATSLRRIRLMKQALSKQLEEPEGEFLRWISKQAYPGKLTRSVQAQLSSLAKHAFNEFIGDTLRLSFFSAYTSGSTEQETASTEESDSGVRIETTTQELEGYIIVKSMLRDVVDVSKVTIRDTQNYCGILLDDNNRKPLCRLHFNRAKKYVGIFDEQKVEKRYAIDSLDDLYKYEDQIRATVGYYTL